jgi:hypothetical protein
MTDLVIARARSAYSHCERTAGPRSNPAAPGYSSAGLLRGLGPLAMTLLAFVLLLSACASPEAHRTRGDGPGADVRNWRKPVELHAGAHPYHKTPCVTGVECNGPPPVFGATPPPD